ncbi:hypothetical protein [Streptomyces avicenniae]|uniref:hypothetical protein n=1 Tax=Streptomyces avicenniae TaxID=500153 RepID=UPI00069B8065|nr:hypothetical protein [Streptomyces avicenniae]
MREQSYEEAALGIPLVRGAWEAHLTVDCPEPETAELAAWAAGRGLGFVHIVLARGRVRSQPMITLTGTGPADAPARTAGPLAAELAAAGRPVTRVKVETPPWAEGVPQDDAVPGARHPARYFEHHVKLLLPGRRDSAALERLATPHGAHLSRNARRTRADGREERFVTQRCAGVGRATAERRLAALLDALTPYRIAEVEREYVVHDSNLALDDGWITEETTP